MKHKEKSDQKKNIPHNKTHPEHPDNWKTSRTLLLSRNPNSQFQNWTRLLFIFFREFYLVKWKKKKRLESVILLVFFFMGRKKTNKTYNDIDCTTFLRLPIWTLTNCLPQYVPDGPPWILHHQKKWFRTIIMRNRKGRKQGKHTLNITPKRCNRLLEFIHCHCKS